MILRAGLLTATAAEREVIVPGYVERHRAKDCEVAGEVPGKMRRRKEEDWFPGPT